MKSFHPLACIFSFAVIFFPGIALKGNENFQRFSDTAGLEYQIKAFTGERSADEPGAVMIISKNGEALYYYATGSADLENGSLIDSNTVFEAASVSKQFTAAAILMLVEQGKLRIDDDVRKYIPELPDYGHQITIKHLLTHTSGLKDWRNITYLFPVYTATRLYDQEMALNLICKQSTLNFKPGDQYRYSNSGYDLLGEIVKRVSGKSFSAFAKDMLLEPAGMKNSRFRNNYTDIIKNRATGYLKSGNGYLQGIILDETCGAAGLYTTVPDLQKWNAFVNADNVSGRFKTLRTTQGTLNNGKKIPYALGGVEVHNYNGQTEIRHGGLISGYRAWLAYYPEAGISVAYLSNDRSLATTRLSELTKEFFFGKNIDTAIYEDLKLNTRELNEIAGKYQNQDDLWGHLELKIKDGKLISGDKPVKFINRKKLSIDNQIYEIKRDQLIQLTVNGDYLFNKVNKISDDIKYEAFTGTYHSKDVDLRFTLHYDGKDFYAIGANSDKIKLTPLYQKGDTFSFRGVSNGLGLIFHFTLLQKTNSTELKLSLPRADMIPFTKIN